MRSVVVLSFLAACGRIGFQATDDAHRADGTADSDVTGDAGPLPAFSVPWTGAPSSIRALAAMPDGAVLVGGYTSGSTAMVGSTPLPNAGGEDLVFGVVEATGSVRWMHAFGTAGNDEIRDVAVHSDGTIFVTGIVSGSVSVGGPALAPGNAFIASYDADGTYRWSLGFGGGGNDLGGAIAAAANGDVIAGGGVTGTVDFGDGVPTPSPGATRDSFVARWSSTGTLRWVRRFGPAGTNTALHIVEDSDGELYISGAYQSAFDLGGGAVPFRGQSDAYLVALHSDGTFRWNQTFGGTDYDRPWALALHGTTLAVGGYYNGTIDLAVPAATGGDAIVAAYSTTGTPGWALAFGGTTCDAIETITSVPEGFLVGGRYTGTITLGGQPLSPVGGSDAVTFTVAVDGTVTGATSSGGAGDDAMNGLALRNDGSVVGAGYLGAGAIMTNCTTSGSGLAELTGSSGFVRSL